MSLLVAVSDFGALAAAGEGPVWCLPMKCQSTRVCVQVQWRGRSRGAQVPLTLRASDNTCPRGATRARGEADTRRGSHPLKAQTRPNGDEVRMRVVRIEALVTCFHEERG